MMIETRGKKGASLALPPRRRTRLSEEVLFGRFVPGARHPGGVAIENRGNSVLCLGRPTTGDFGEGIERC